MTVDHLVWYSASLDEGARYFADKMDREPAYGGVHPGEGTCNSLLSLADNTYVEILGRDPAQPAKREMVELEALWYQEPRPWRSGAFLHQLDGKRASGKNGAARREFR